MQLRRYYTLLHVIKDFFCARFQPTAFVFFGGGGCDTGAHVGTGGTEPVIKCGASPTARLFWLSLNLDFQKSRICADSRRTGAEPTSLSA